MTREGGRGPEDLEKHWRVIVDGKRVGDFPRKQGIGRATTEGLKGKEVTVERLRPGKPNITLIKWSGGQKTQG